MRVCVAKILAVTGLIACGFEHPALAAWSGFEQPVGGLCTFGSPLPARVAAVVIAGRFEVGSGRAGPTYSLVFSANDGTPEITKLDVSVDEQEVARFDVVSHVPAALGASGVVALSTETLGTLFHATDTSKVLHVLVPSVWPSYDFDLTGFAKASDMFARCMLLLLNAQDQILRR